uniref:C2H2-type domain-containing protein n=1 Tax=Anopheles atroparvus TaxID=41427 RepID=A0A182JCN0_ANOAO
MAKSHGGEEARPFKCDKCGIGYPKQYLLRAHETMHVQAECKICNKILSSHHSLKVHITQMHSDDSNHICATCGKIFRTKVAMERHIKEHMGLELTEKLECPYCHKWFNGKYNLKKHVRYLHNEEGQVFRCDICQHVSPNSRALSYHKQRVHVEEKHECEYCGKRFKRKLYLREHIASHTGNPLYTCEICEFFHYSKRVQRNQELLEGECLDTLEDKSSDNVHFENVIIDGTGCEIVDNGTNSETDGQTEDPQDTIDDLQMYEAEGEECLSDEGDGDSSSIKSNPDLTADSLHVTEEGEPPSLTNDDAVEAVWEEKKVLDRFLRCNLCDRLFSNSLHFKTHQREHRKKDCPICEKRVYANYLQRHIADVHKAKARNKRRPRSAAGVHLPVSQYERDRMIDVFIGMRCELCQFGICQTFADLQQHYRTKHGVQGYVRCCGEKFATQVAAAEHVLVHQGTIRCETCDKSFTTRSSLKHMADVHAVFPKVEECSSREQTLTHHHVNDQMILDYLGMRCELCPPETEQHFDQFKHLRTHYRTVHSIRGYVRCCGRQFFIRSLAAEHIAAHQGALRCHLCDKTFTARSSVVNHIATMHPSYDSGNGSYDCDECDSTFLNKLQLRLHKKRHKLTSIECSLCGKTVRSDYIQQHIATQHGEERRKLMCHICGKEFASEAALNVHIKQHVNPDVTKSVIDRIQCSICNKMIRGKYSLKKHMKDMHSDASNQACTVCGKFIRSNTAMKQHLKMHQGQGHI